MKRPGADVWKQAAAVLGRYRYALIVAAAGAALLLLPPLWGGAEEPAPAQAGAEQGPEAGLEERLERALSRIDGAGEVEVVLTVKGGPRQVLA